MHVLLSSILYGLIYIWPGAYVRRWAEAPGSNRSRKGGVIPLGSSAGFSIVDGLGATLYKSIESIYYISKSSLFYINL